MLSSAEAIIKFGPMRKLYYSITGKKRKEKSADPPPRQSGLGSGAGKPDDLPNLMGTFLIQRYVCGKILMKIRSIFPEMQAKLWENVAVLKNPSKQFWTQIRCIVY